jgi:hypothetical protein
MGFTRDVIRSTSGTSGPITLGVQLDGQTSASTPRSCRAGERRTDHLRIRVEVMPAARQHKRAHARCQPRSATAFWASA